MAMIKKLEPAKITMREELLCPKCQMNFILYTTTEGELKSIHYHDGFMQIEGYN